VQDVINKTISKWGHIDILVNNAGACVREGLEDITDEERDMDTHLRGSFSWKQPILIYGRVVMFNEPWAYLL
jgi:NADP-dependent 3-hydroxy acid dehydrogenase YdfG